MLTAMTLAIAVAGLALLLRILQVLPQSPSSAAAARKQFSGSGPQRKLMAVLGSGGHTMEMFDTLRGISKSTYSPRIYVLAATDSTSHAKVAEFEDGCSSTEYTLEKIPRSREVGQSFLSSIPSTVLSIFKAVPLVMSHRPDVIICNGPGTCLPILVVAFLLRVFAIKNTHLIYIESICRVTTLSLTGRIVYPFVNSFLVLWPELTRSYPRAEYIGPIVG